MIAFNNRENLSLLIICKYEDFKITITVFRVIILTLCFTAKEKKRLCVSLNHLATEICINFSISKCFYYGKSFVQDILRLT